MLTSLGRLIGKTNSAKLRPVIPADRSMKALASAKWISTAQSVGDLIGLIVGQ